jgi:hypothetical protein
MKASTVGMVAAAFLMLGSAAYAAEPQGWQVELTPYAWLAGIEGDLTVNGHKAEFDKSFSDLVDAVELGASLLTVAQYDRYLIWGQVDYFQMSTDAMDVEDQPKHGSLDTKLLLGEVAVGYQLDGWMEGQTFDLLVGVRALHTEMELEVYGKGTFEKDNDLLDPILVLRPSIPVFPSKINGLRFNPTLAIGGGGDADLVYELQPQFQYQVTENVAARVGYRRVGYKFKGDHNDDNELNIALAGMIVGLGVTF